MNFRLILIAFLLTGSISKACDPNENCEQRGPSLPCPTWSQPGRMCPSYVKNPICEARKLVCRKDCSNINKDASDYISTFNQMILKSKQIISDQQLELLSLQASRTNTDLTIQDIDQQQSTIIQTIKQCQKISQNIGVISGIQNEIKNFQSTELSSSELEILKTKYSTEDDEYQLILGIQLIMNSNQKIENIITQISAESFITFMVDSLQLNLENLSKIKSNLNENQINQIELQSQKVNIISKEQTNIKDYEKRIQEQESRKCPPLF